MSSRCGSSILWKGSAFRLLTGSIGQAMRFMKTAHVQAFKFEDRFLINPGSATGAYSDVIKDPKPSFVLMDIDGSKVCKASST